MPRSINKNISFGLGLVSASLVAIGIGAFLDGLKLKQNTNWFKHNQEAIVKSEQLISAIKDVEIMQCHYFLTGNKRFVEPYNEVADTIDQKIEELRQLTADNPNQQKRIDEIELLSAASLTALNNSISLRQKKGLEAVVLGVYADEEKPSANRRILQIISEIENEENQLWQSRSQQEKNIIAAGSSIALLIGALSIWLLNRDSQKHQQIQDEELRQLAGHIREVFWISLPEKNQMLYVSPECEEIWGKSCESLSERCQRQNATPPRLFIEAIHPDDRDRSQTAADKQIRGEYDEEYRMIRPDGEICWIRDRAFGMLNDKKEIYRILTIAENITERKHLDETLRQESEKLAEANRLKSEFLGIAAHELRTPLSAILGWAQLLRNRKFDESATARALETIERNAKVQNQLIENLLDFSRIDRGNIQLEIGTVNLKDTTLAAIDKLRMAASNKNIRVDFVPDPSVIFVLGDSLRLHQVVWNLLSNAIKFTPNGGRVEIRVSAEMANESSEIESGNQECPFDNYSFPITQYAQIQVSDTGIGIDPDFLPDIFDLFRLVDSKTTRLKNGLRLGLAIVWHLVKLHGGTIQATSEGEGKGTQFTVRLPLQSVKAREGEKENFSPSPPLSLSPPLAGVRVLVVEDDVNTRPCI